VTPPSARERPRSRKGAFVIAAMLLLGVGFALAAKRWRVPGAVPQVRLFPAEEEIHDGAGGWSLPPAEPVPARLAARLRVIAAEGGIPLEAQAFPGADAEGLVATTTEGGAILVELPLDRRKGTPRPRAEVEIRVVGRPSIRTSVPLFPSTRADGLDAAIYRVRVPR
jgi:hypothetical protein